MLNEGILYMVFVIPYQLTIIKGIPYPHFTDLK